MKEDSGWNRLPGLEYIAEGRTQGLGQGGLSGIFHLVDRRVTF